MANIPIIPGVSVTPMGILNKPIKDIVCAILFGGINNMLKGNLLCVNLDLEQLLDEPIVADLKAELLDLKNDLKAMEELSGIKDVLGRVNQAVAEVQNLLALDGLCKIPLKAPKIPDILNSIIDAEFNNANAILNDIGKLAKPKLCIDAKGGLNTGSYKPGSILADIQKHLKAATAIPGQQLNILKRRLTQVSAGLKASINRQLFPDFRHKADLTTGKKYSKGGAGVILASKAEQQKLFAKIRTDSGTPAGLLAWQQVSAMPGASAEEIVASYPPGDSSLKDAVGTAQTLISGMKKTASYPSTVNGIASANVWPGVLGPDLYAMAVAAMSPQDPLFVQQDPLYDYCGKFVGYNETVITGDSNYKGGDAKADAVIDPPTTNFEFLWIADRQCWAVTGVQSEQLIDIGRDKGRQGIYLTRCPTITLHRAYNHILSIPSYDPGDPLVVHPSAITGSGSAITITFPTMAHAYKAGQAVILSGITAKDGNSTAESYNGTYTVADSPAPTTTSITLAGTANGTVLVLGQITNAPVLAPEFFICKVYYSYVRNRLEPIIDENGEIVKFNMGLSRLETSEVLEDANGWLPSDSEHEEIINGEPVLVNLPGIDGPEGINRRQENPLGTTMYFSIEQTRHTGTDQPLYPDKDIWWYNPETLETQRWLPDDIGGGQWIPISDQDREDTWYGSSYIPAVNPADQSINYLAYSNKDGSIFGLFKLI